MRQLISFRILLPLALLFGAMSVASASDRFYLDPVNIEAGEMKTLSFNLENDQVFYGFQADIILPDGILVETDSNGKFECSLSSRFDSSYSLFSNSLADGSIRFGAFSSNHTAISGSNGAVLLVNVRASDNFEGGTLYIKNAYFVGNGDNDIVLDDYSITLGNKHNNKCYIQDFTIAVGETKTVSLELNNETPFSAFQTDLYFPDGIIMSDCSVSDRSVDHTVSAKYFSDGRTRVVCMSLSNSLFDGDTGAILNIQLTATKDAAESSAIQINNSRFTTIDAREYILSNSNTNVNVERALVTEIQLNYNSLNLVVGDHQFLQATVLPTYASTKDVEWSSENTNVVTVSETGYISAVGIGSTKITVSAVDGSGVKAYCLVDVKGTSVSQIQLSQDYLEMETNENYQLTYSILPTNASDKSVTWSSSNQDVAIIDNNGMIRTLNIGETIIKVTSNSNPDVNAVCRLIVVPTLVEYISITPNNISLQVGQTATLKTAIIPDSATNKEVTWSSDNESVVIVSDLGVVSAISIGSTNITAIAKDGSGVFAKCVVNVIPTIAESIQIDSPINTSFKVGEKIQLTATVFPENATDKSIVWSSSNKIVASVDNNGIVTANSEGNVTITATNSVGQTDEIELIVIPTLAEHISLMPNNVTLQALESIDLIATISPATTTNKSVIWTSSNESVAVVDDNGHVIAKSVGQTTIMATTIDGSNLTAEAVVIVEPTLAENITIIYEGNKSLMVGQKAQLSALIYPETATDKSIIWNVQDSNVLNIDANGLVTAISVGESWVSATNSAGHVDYVNFTVVPTMVSSISLDRSSVSLKVGEMTRLTAFVYPDDATDKTLEWMSEDESIAMVDNEGNVLAKSLGSVVVAAIATDGSGVSASCDITVVPTPVESVAITSEGSTTIKVGETVQLYALVSPETATDKSVVWQSIDQSIATIDNNGLVTAQSVGTTMITATSGEKTAEITITVDKTLAESIVLNKTSYELRVSETVQLVTTIFPSTTTITEVEWLSSDLNVAYVDAYGNVVAVGIGNAIISAKTIDGSHLETYCLISVVKTPVEQVVIEYDGSSILQVGDQVQLSAYVMPETSTDKSINWKSQNENILTVNDNGLVTAVGLGEAWVGAFAEGDYPYECVTFAVVETPVESILVTPMELSLKVSEYATISAVVLPESATDKSLLWKSENPEIAIVTQEGVVQAIEEGVTKIIVSSSNGVTKDIIVNVVDTPVERVSITANGSTVLKDGETLQLYANVGPITATDKSIIWSSSDEECATVDINGLITAHAKLGDVTITGTSVNGISDNIILTIIATPPTSIVIDENKSTSILKPGQTGSVVATVLPETTTNKTISWACSDESIIQLTSNGEFTALAPGTAIIYASTINGIKCTWQVNVEHILVQAISITPTDCNINVGEKVDLAIDIIPENASNKELSWIVSNPEVVSVLEDNAIVGVKQGNCVITYYTIDGSNLSASCNVIVSQQVTSVTLNEHNLELKEKETYQLIATVMPIDATNKSVLWSSSNVDFVDVDTDTGLIEAKSQGEATITASSAENSSIFDECNVKVSETNGIQTVSINDIDVRIENNMVIVSGLAARTNVRLINLKGVVLTSVCAENDMVTLRITPNEVYILSVGNYSLKIVAL